MGLPFIKSAPKERHLLAIEYNPHESRLAYFHDDQGELIFGGNSVGATPENAFTALQEKPAKVSDIIVGVPFEGLTDSSTVVRYRRANPQTKITEDEIKNAITQIPPMEGEVFFEDLFDAKVDGLATLEPTDRMGELVELNYYQVAGDKDQVEKIQSEAKKLGADPGVVPTAYAIGKLVAQTSPKGALVLDLDPDRTELTLSADGHLVGIKSFDIGGGQEELFVQALEAALEDLDYSDLWPETVYLCGTIGNYEKIRSALLAFPWNKKFNMMSFPTVSVFHPLSVNLTLPADVGLNALSLLG